MSTSGALRTAIASSRSSFGDHPVDSADDGAVDGAGGELARPGPGELGAQLLVLVVEDAQLVELAPHPARRVARGADELGDLAEVTLVALQQRDGAGAGRPPRCAAGWSRSSLR